MRVLISVVSLCGVVVAALPASAQSAVERGRYLVEVVGACGNCHPPNGPGGDLSGKHLAGGFQLDDVFGTWITPNITPDHETGIGRWTDEEVIRAIRDSQGIAEGDLRAIIAYLRSLPPIRYTVPAPEPPKKP